VRADFLRPNAPDRILGSARWTDGGRVSTEAPDQESHRILERIFRSAPVAVEDPSLRSFGTAGPIVLQPGSLRWFQAAARHRASAEGLIVRFVDEEQGAMGWDPAGAYRPFAEAIERKVNLGGPRERRSDTAGGGSTSMVR
jgi:hypothetical protein